MNSQKNLFDVEPDPWSLDDLDDFRVASIVFPEAPFGPYSYLIPDHLVETLAVGMRVSVPLGKSRKVIGYCVETVQGQQLGPSFDRSKLKPISDQIDEVPLVNSTLLELANWISNYYLCPLGTVIETIVPASVRSRAGTREVSYLSVPNSVIAKLTQLQLPKKQADALRILAASTNPLTVDQLAEAAGCSAAPVKALVEKRLVVSSPIRIYKSNHDLAPQSLENDLELNEAQSQALDAMTPYVRNKEFATLLLFGITGSGKTEVYIRAIQEVLKHRRQAIVLVPEISLTPQTRQRFRARFDRVAVLHSHLSPAERNWHWKQIASGNIDVVVGARSAVFAPLPNLGMIVIDEEHDASFKQDKAPRYHARNVAQRRAKLAGVPLVLGSATPALESYQRAIAGEYQMVPLPHRVMDRPLPAVDTIDLRSEQTSPGNRGAISRPLQNAIRESIDDGGQVLLMLNRRGFATSIQCPACGHVVECPNCDIALTHHIDTNRSICHYCDHTIASPSRCVECDHEGIRFAGLGTQKLEAEVKRRFPDTTCLRMDSDTMQRHGSHEEALDRFRAGEIKILLGTQMIAKGLDFPNVTLVGVINADTALHLPDFRAGERTFCLVTQVAGRTGRGTKGGRVLVQTFNPENPTLQAAVGHDYEKFAELEIPQRKEFGYPPFLTMARVVVRGNSETQTAEFAEFLASELRREPIETHSDGESHRVTILGPAPAPISKLRGRYRFHLFVSGADEPQVHERLSRIQQSVKTPEEIQWIIDIDPLDML